MGQSAGHKSDAEKAVSYWRSFHSLRLPFPEVCTRPQLQLIAPATARIVGLEADDARYF
jgi:hypothetical protein